MYKMRGRMFSEKYENSITSHIPRHPQLSITCSMKSVRSLGTRLGMCGESLRMRLVVGGESLEMRLVVGGESLEMRLVLCEESLGMRLVYELYIKGVYYCH